jgi:YXWGXW repeat-containing protein
MKNRLLAAVACAAVGALLLSVSCLVPPPPPGAVYVRMAPPVPVVEVSGVAPGPGYVWVRGYHRWNGNAYVWTSGRWERRPRAGAVWVDGRWRHHRNGYYWVEGHWK